MRKRIGEFLMEKGIISPTQLDEILRYSARTGQRFGEAGLALQYYTREDLIRVFGQNYQSDFFYLDYRYFPEATRRILTAEQVIRLGALPLGFKTERRFFRERRVLNIGMLDPQRVDAVKEVERIARESRDAGKKIDGTKVFLVLTDQFLDVVRSVYGVPEGQMRDFDPARMEPVLAMYLEQDLRTDNKAP